MDWLRKGKESVQSHCSSMAEGFLSSCPSINGQTDLMIGEIPDTVSVLSARVRLTVRLLCAADANIHHHFSSSIQCSQGTLNLMLSLLKPVSVMTSLLI